MIHNQKDYRSYLACDAINYKNVAHFDYLRGWIRSHFLIDPISDQRLIWAYIKCLRKCELSKNGWGNFLLLLWRLHKLRRLGRKTGFQIPPNVCGKGLTIWHWGTIIVNGNSKIGDFCTLYPNVLIGHKDPSLGAPKIGNYVTICSGARIIGNIQIGDDVIIAPNSVVTKTIPPHSIVAGIPARIIKVRDNYNSKWKKYE